MYQNKYENHDYARTMTDSRRVVEKILETEPVIRKGLQWGIINTRALARHIQVTNRLDSSPEAILGIIRRFPVQTKGTDDHPRVLENCELAMKDKMAGLVLENGPETMKKISEFASSIRSTRGESLRVVVGLRWITVVANQKSMHQFRESLNSKEVFRYDRDLVEISILLNPAAPDTKGVFAKITNELLVNDVNLVSIETSYLEIILLVKEEDAPRAIETLQRVISEESTADFTVQPAQEIMRNRSKTSV